MRKFFEKVSKGYELLCKAEMFMCCILFLMIVILVFMSALLRKFNAPIAWTVDVSQLCFAWVAFFGADIALRKGSLVGVDLITMRFNPKTQMALKLINYALMFCFVIILISFGFPLALKNWNRSFQTLTISYGVVTLSLPCAAIFMLMSIIHNVIQLFRKSEEVEKCGCC